MYLDLAFVNIYDIVAFYKSYKMAFPFIEMFLKSNQFLRIGY